MDNLIKKQGYNVQGVRNVLYNDINNITSVPEVSGSPNYIVDMSAMVVTADWNYPAMTRFTGKFTEQEIEKNGQIWYRQQLTFFIAKDDSLRWNTFNDMKHHEFMVAVRDNNNKSRFCGYINLQGEKRGMKFKADLGTDKVNGYDCIFYMDSPHRAIHCNLLGELGLEVDPINPSDGDVDVIDIS